MKAFATGFKKCFLALHAYFFQSLQVIHYKGWGCHHKIFYTLIRKLCQNFICVGTEPGQRA